MFTTLDGKRFATEAEVLADHDEGEVLHAFIPDDGPNGEYYCKECGDTEEGLMHNNTERNIEPLLIDAE